MDEFTVNRLSSFRMRLRKPRWRYTSQENICPEQSPGRSNSIRCQDILFLECQHIHGPFLGRVIGFQDQILPLEFYRNYALEQV